MQNRRKFLKYTALIASASIVQPFNSFKTINPKDKPQDNESSILPTALKVGDKVIIVSPAGAVFDLKKMEEFSTILSNLGFVVEVAKSALNRVGYLAGTDHERAEDINNAFADKSIKAIFCTRGGWGCARILSSLDYKLIAENPKVIMGFSDITSLLLAINAKTKLITFHGPVGLSSWDPFSTLCFTNTVFLGNRNVFPFGVEDKTIVLNQGMAQGELIGGNLTVFNSLLGTEYFPNCENKILFLEELNEDPYKIDRMLTQLKLAGVLDKLTGFVFGACTKCVSEDPLQSFTILEVIKHHVLPLNIPAIYNEPFGHTPKKWTLPIGAMAELDSNNLKLELLQSAVIV
jgi:muramoyltetrapeptide carboxypeptidase